MPKRQATPKRAPKVPPTAEPADVDPTQDKHRASPDEIDQAVAQAHDRARERTGADD